MNILDTKCVAPKDPRPGVTTLFCVYDKGHAGSHSWQDPPDVRREKLAAAKPLANDADARMRELEQLAKQARALAAAPDYDREAMRNVLRAILDAALAEKS